MFLRFLVFFTIIPILELYLLLRVGAIIGAGTTLFVILLTGIIGATLARSQGTQIIRNIQSAMNEGRMPAAEMIHGLVIFFGGITLLTPGFITDFMGFLMLIPWTRAYFIQWIKYWLYKNMRQGNFQIHIH